MVPRTLQCFAVLALFAVAKAQPVEPTPVQDPYISTQFLSYLGYIMLGVFLSIAFSTLTYLCCSVPPRAISLTENLKLQLPDVTRLLKSDLRLVDVGLVEGAACIDYGELAHTSRAFMVWRRAQLSMACIMNIAVLILNIIVLHNAKAFEVQVLRDETESDSLALRERAREQLLQFIPLAQSIIATVFTAAASWNWAAYKQSIRINVLGWALVFFIPFLYFFVPWMDIVSPKEQVQGLCTFLLDIMDQIFNDPSGETYMVNADGSKFSVTSVCTRGIKGMTSSISDGMQILDQDGNQATSQLVLTFIGMLLQYIIYLPFLVGALNTLKNLGPGVLGMMLGLQGGLKMSKLMFPGLRVTSWMLIILQASALPVVMCLMALLLVVVGTVPVMFTAIFITAAMSLFLVFADQLLRAVTRDESLALMTRIARLSMVLMLLGFACLVLGVYLAEHLVALSDMGINAVKSFMKPLFITKLLVKTLAGMFASKVVFMDVVLHIIISTYIGVYEDDKAARKEIFDELSSFGKLFPQYSAYAELEELEMNSVSVRERPVAGQPVDGGPASPHLLSLKHGSPTSTYSPPAPSFSQQI